MVMRERDLPVSSMAVRMRRPLSAERRVAWGVSKNVFTSKSLRRRLRLFR